MLYANVDGISDPLKQDLALEFYRSQNKDICILSETHINQEQIHQIRNNWLGQFFSLLERPTQKACLSCLIQVLMITLGLTQIQKGGLCPSGLLPPMTVFSVFMLLQDSTREQLAREEFL